LAHIQLAFNFGGGRVGIDMNMFCITKNYFEMMVIVSITILLLFLIAFIYNFYNCEEFVFSIDLNLFNSQFFKIGLFNDRYVYEEYKVDVLSIGLLFLNIEFEFYKELEA
jgi:hypothetical protein